MLILALILFVISIALFKDGSSDARKLGILFLGTAVLLFVLKVDLSFMDKAVLAIVSTIAQVAEVVLQFFCLTLFMIFYGPIMLLFGKRKD